MKISPLFFLIFLPFFSCKKERPAQFITEPQTSARSKFKDTISNTITSTEPVFAANSKAGNSFYIIQKKTGTDYSLFKADADMNVVLSKTINLGAGNLMQVKGSQISDDFYTINATNNFTYTYSGQIINAYVYGGSNTDSLMSCDSISPFSYNLDNAFDSKYEINLQNTTTLRKFDHIGNESWVKTLDGHFHSGNCIETDLYGNVYALTLTKGGYRTHASTQYTAGSVPYFDFKLDSNEFSLYKFDINGTQVFKKTFTNVYDATPGNFHPRLAVSADNICVYNLNNLFVFDLSGTIIPTIKPVKNTCYNNLLSVAGNVNKPNLLIHGRLNYVNGGNNNPNYLVKLNQGLYTSPVTGVSGSVISLMDSKGNYYHLGGGIMKWEGVNGDLQYSKQIYSPAYVDIQPINTLTDKFDNVYVFEKRLNHILVYKLDSYGNFQ